MSQAGSNNDIFFTRTMARVLESQGRMEDALMIYKMLSDGAPEDEGLKESIDRLKNLAGKKGTKAGNK